MGDRSNSNMNVFEREIALPYLLCRDGYKCNRCKISLNSLLEAALIKEEYGGKPRILPLLTVDLIDDVSSHRVDIYNVEIMNNLQLTCYPCNRNKNLHKLDLSASSGREPSREKKDNLAFEAAFHRNFQTYLHDNQEACFKLLMMNSKNFSEGGNQVTVIRYFENELYTKVNKKGKYQKFPFKCDAEECNGTHICLVGTKPTKLLDAERQQLESTWYVEYFDKREKFKNHTGYSGKHYMQLEEYVNTHCMLLAHNFK